MGPGAGSPLAKYVYTYMHCAPQNIVGASNLIHDV